MKQTKANIVVKGVDIHGRNLKKFFDYYFELYTSYDQIHRKNNGVRNPYLNELIGIERAFTMLDIRDQWNKYFGERRLTHEYWIERDAQIKNNKNK